MQFAVCLVLGVAATAEDLWRRRISNHTVVAGLLAGLAIQIGRRGWARGPLGWLAGTAAGFAIFLIFYLLGGMGGGDIKLMAAMGGCLGTPQILVATLWTAIIGAVAACGKLAWIGWRRSGRRRRPGAAVAAGAETIPYAPSILIGTLLSFWS
ncbi:MAG: prepilin peptidase [Acidobacteria bacterium]|nr:prepilin peptidase [Acidobacteriota bacterium]